MMDPHRSGLTLLLLALVACAGAERTPRREARTPVARPNVLIIMSDDHGYQATGAYGSRINTTPAIDRLGREGARFDRSFVTNSLCTPSRAAILTGEFSHVTGVRALEQPLRRGQVTFPGLLRAAGYRTAIIGKWHLEDAPEGFDDWQILPRQGEYYDPEFITAHGTERAHGYVTDVITDRVIAFLRAQDGHQPFLMMMHHKAPHRPWLPGPNELDLYRTTTFAEPPTLFDDYAHRASPARNQRMEIGRDLLLQEDLKVGPPGAPVPGPYDHMTASQRAAWERVYSARARDYYATPRTGADLTRWKYQEFLRDYLGCVAGVDHSVGRVLDELDRLGLARNTIVIYVSDQGFYLGEHGWFDKRFMYEESFRTPLLMRWPAAIQPGTVVTDLVQNLDYAQTVLDAAGVAAPASMQGQSFLPLVRGQRIPWRSSLYYHYYDDTDHGLVPHYGVRTTTEKLIFYPRTNEWEMFDLADDPLELHSHYGEPAYTARIEALTRELTRLRTLYGDHE